MVRNFENLEIWKKSRVLNLKVYELTYKFPEQEKFALSTQMRRASISIVSNIAEGCGRNTIKQLKYFLQISLGSLCELESQVIISSDLGYCSQEDFFELRNDVTTIRKMIVSFIKRI